MITIILFIIILGLLVFVHELGHFIMAKRAGMRVDEFGFGFPPRLFGIRKGETIYSINWIPLGGFVKIVGEDGGQADDPRSFAAKSFTQRLLTLAAGVTMNVIFAWLLISFGLGLGLPTVVTEGEQLPAHATLKNVSVAILEVSPQSPAESAEVKVGDHITKINGQEITSLEQVQTLTSQISGSEATYEITRGTTVLEKKITPRANPPEDQGPLGISLANVGLVSYPWYMVLFKGVTATVNLIWGTITAFWDVITNLLSGAGPGISLSGPVGIAKLTGDVAALGFIYLLQFTAVLSINLAIINGIPFPALDGGRILFLVVEKLRGKKMNAKAEQIANTLGFALLLLLMLFVTIKDVRGF